MVKEVEGTFNIEGKSLYTKSWLVRSPSFLSLSLSHYSSS